MCRIKKTNTKYKTHNAYRLCSSDYMKYFNETDIDQAKQLCILSAKRALHPTSIEAELMLQAPRGGDSWHEQLISLSVAVCSETRPMRVSRRGTGDWQGFRMTSTKHWPTPSSPTGSGGRSCCIAPIGRLGRPYWCYYERHLDTLYIYWAQLSGKRETWCSIPITSAFAIIRTYGVTMPESDIRCIVYRTSTQPTSNGDTHVVRPERRLGDGHEEL